MNTAMEEQVHDAWRPQAKWGAAVAGGETGFHVVPDVLVRGQSTLGITATELVVVLNLLLHWWKADSFPHPRPSVIAKRMGVSTRTVERAIQSLEDKGLIRRLPPEKKDAGPTVRRFDMSGLVKAVQQLAEEFHLAV